MGRIHAEALEALDLVQAIENMPSKKSARVRAVRVALKRIARIAKRADTLAAVRGAEMAAMQFGMMRGAWRCEQAWAEWERERPAREEAHAITARGAAGQPPSVPPADIGEVPRDLWQPIATAPKDGRSMLVSFVNASGKRRTVKAAFFDAATLDMDDGACDDAVDEEGKNVYAGWYEDSETHEPGYMPLSADPTHWQPLPPPPITGRP